MNLKMKKILNFKTVLKLFSFSLIGVAILWTLEVDFLDKSVMQSKSDIEMIEKLEKQYLIDSLRMDSLKKEGEKKMSRQSIRPESREKLAQPHPIEETKPKQTLKDQEKTKENQIVYIREKDEGMSMKELITWIISSINGLVMAALAIKQLFFKKSSS